MANAEETNLKKFSNWLQSVQALEDTKAALGQHVLDIWKKRLMKWKAKADLKTAIPIFFCCVTEKNVKYQTKKKKWNCICPHGNCEKILKNLLSLQQNPGSGIVWNSNLCEELNNNVDLNVQVQADTHTDTTENITRTTLTNLCCDVRTIAARVFQVSNEERNDIVSFEDIFEGCTERHVWSIANMFMQRGEEKPDIHNTGPGDTDAAMFFRMMKNCKLFEIDENDLYDKILVCRNRLHHSTNNRIKREEAESHLKTMTALLKKFDNVPKCQNAIENIEKIRKETIVCISMPDVNIREIAKKVLPLKKSALEVDIEIDKDKGFIDDDKVDMLAETRTELENAKDPEKALNEVKSRAEYKQELEEKTNNALQQQNEASGVQRRSNPREVKAVQEEKKIAFQSRKIKDPEKYLEGVMNLLLKSMHIPNVADYIDQRVNPFLEDIVEDLSNKDREFGTKAKEFTKDEDTNDDITFGTSSAAEQESVSPLQPSEDNIKPIPDVRLRHLWSVASEHTYNISVVGEHFWSITGYCQLPSGESLLVDFFNRRLKKLNTKYEVIAVCDFEENPWDVCYTDKNEVVVSVLKTLTFVDVVKMTVIRSVNTERECEGLGCHGNLLYVAENAGVYEYNTDGIKLRVLYSSDDSGTSCPTYIAVSDDGSKIYILHNAKLTAIDHSGEQLYTFENPSFVKLEGLSVDGEGNVLVCETSSGNILQISSDGSYRCITDSKDNISTAYASTLYIDRQRSKLICGGKSNILTVLHLS